MDGFAIVWEWMCYSDFIPLMCGIFVFMWAIIEFTDWLERK